MLGRVCPCEAVSVVWRGAVMAAQYSTRRARNDGSMTKTASRSIMCSITKNACMCNTILAAIEEALAVLVRDADVEDIDDDDVEHNLHAEKCAVDQK